MEINKNTSNNLKNNENMKLSLNLLDSNTNDKKAKVNGFKEDSNIKQNENDLEKNSYEEVNVIEKTPSLTRKKKFVEDNINNSIELTKNTEKTSFNISPKILKKKKADYIYDFVKIRVHLDNHFYILSRFFISRMLTLCKVSLKI